MAPAGAARRPRRRPRGFTLVELIAVLLLASVLAAVALPKLQGASTWRNNAWRDQVLAALRQARHLAVGHRRLVCADLANGAVTLTIAAANPATACSAALPGPDGDSRWAREATGITTSVSPSGTLYFQPSGRITRDGAGTTAANASISLGGESAVTLVGETGHVE